MGKAALWFVGAFMLAGIYLSFGSQENENATSTNLASSEVEVLARNAALAGIDHVTQLLADDFQSYSNVTGSHDGGSYSVDATVTGTNVVVHSTGTAMSTDGEAITFNVQSKYQRVTELPPEAPIFMSYALISDRDLTLRGSIEGDAYIDSDADNTLNADMHTNGSLGVNGEAAMVRGYGTYVMTANPSAVALYDNFVPNYVASAENEHVYQTSTIDIPELVPAYMAASMRAKGSNVIYTDGNVELAGNYNFGGTRENPYIWHITGDLTVARGGSTIDGYVLFLVDGEIDFRANVRAGSSGYDGGDESSMAFYSGGTYYMRGDTEVWGQVFAQAGVLFDVGTPTIYGSVTTNGFVEFRGTVNIFYRKASPALTTELQDNIYHLELVAYSEW